MITPVDEVSLRRLVGATTFARGQAYADQGAVRSRQWAVGGCQVRGQVQGASAEPYDASVRLIRSPSKGLAAVAGTCTCPVGTNCKHAVALLLAKVAPPASPDREPSDRSPSLKLLRSDPRPGPAKKGVRPRTSGWEGPLQALLLAGAETSEVGSQATIALQFELVADRPNPAKKRGTTSPGIRIRPVIPGRAGNWVRAGISWASLDYFQYGKARTGETAERLTVLKELLSISRPLRPRYSYGSGDDAVWLDAINSRRVWDVLHEARDLGIPLLRTGRHAQAVTLRSSCAAVTVDITRTPSQLQLQPCVDIDRDRVPLESSLLIGSPAHGIAWWDQTPRSSGTTEHLRLAAFSEPVDETLRVFLGRGAVCVPSRDEERFWGNFYPLLRRKVAVTSSDESVELPEVAPNTLMLSVAHGEGHRIDLSWAIGNGNGERLKALWDDSPVVHRDAADEALVEQATGIAGVMPELLEMAPFGERLAATRQLEAMDALRFVTEVLPALQEIAGVVVDQVGVVPDYREAAEAPVVSLSGSESGDGDWFDLTVSVTVSGEEVPFADLFVALAEGQTHLILPSGTYFSLDSAELHHLAELIAEARLLHDASGERIRLSRFQVSLWDDLVRLGVLSAQAGEWEASVRALTDATDRTDHPVPETLSATLRPYQVLGFNWLAYLAEHRLGGILADDMGLGKTLQALALMCHTRERGLSDAPYLVVAPTSVVGNWAAECGRFAPDLAAVAITETTSRRGATLASVAAEADVVITSYSLFRLEYEDYAAVTWTGMFLDEAQFAKNRRSQTFQRAKMLPVPFKVAMTGTPMENSLMELWSLLSITAPGLFVSPEHFGEYYRVPIEKLSNAERLTQLRRRVRPLMLRRTKEQVAPDLPDKQEQVLELDLNPRHKRLYETYLQRERQKILGLLGDMTKNRFEIFRSLTLLRQASLDVSLVDPKHAHVPSTKLDALMEMLTDIVADGHRVLVFSQFTRFLGLARQRIDAAGIEHCYLDGSTRNRPAVISEFRAGEAPVFLISLKAGGFGLNLTEADYCILLDPWWNPATEAQAVDRIHRIGQTRKVMVYRLVAKDTLEEKVMALKAKKAALFANVMDAGGFESGALTAADIRSLVT